MGNHRAQRAPRRRTSATTRAMTPAQPTAGKRRANPPARPSLLGSLPSLRSLPSLPLIAGVAVLAVATSGAVSAADNQAIDQVTTQFSAGAAAGSLGSAALAERGQVVSRSSAREAAPEEVDPALEALMEKRAERYQAQLAQMRRDGDKQAAKIEENKWVLPLSSYGLTATFGQYGLWASYHTGLDFNGDSGDPIMAIANGTITSTGYDGAYGNKTVLTLDDGTEIWFAHQTSIHVSVGQRVRGGEVIGTVGSTGNSTGSHLHLEVRPGGGNPVDPFQAFVQHGIVP